LGQLEDRRLRAVTVRRNTRRTDLRRKGEGGSAKASVARALLYSSASMRTLAFVALVTSVACSPGVGKDPEPMMQPMVDHHGPFGSTPKIFPVAGTGELHSMTLGGDIVEPLSYSDGATIAAFLEDHTPLDLVMIDDAHFMLPAVPKDSAYYLQRGDQWVV